MNARITRLVRPAWRSWASVLALSASLASLGAARAADVALIHDIPAGHVRLPYFDVLAADIKRRTGLDVVVNPGDKIYLGKAGLDAVRNGTVPLGLVNTAHIEAVSPRVGFINLPFSIDDEVMAASKVRDGVVDLINASLDVSDIRVIGLMRAADQVFVFRDRQLDAPGDLKGVKVRVAGSGVYEEIMASLGAVPVTIPPREIKTAVAAGAVDGVFTSPGGWESTVGLSAPKANLVPGLMFITYSLVANRAWFDALPDAQRAVIAELGRAVITEGWTKMRDDDLRLIAAMVAKGASFHSVEPARLQPWKALVAPVSARFDGTNPETAKAFAAVLGSGTARP